MGERFLNNRVREDLKTRPMVVPISDLTLDVKPNNRIVAFFKIALPILGTQSLSVPFQLESAGGRVGLKAIETPIGTVQVAVPLTDLISKEINDRVARTGEALQFDIVSLSTSEDEITIGLHARE
jgi:hypothetical protein